MCRQPTWTLLISWMAACTAVKMEHASTKGLVIKGTPIATVHESSLPTLNADPFDHSITGLRSVGWAGIGDIPNNLQQPSSISLPKWVPDYQPVKEKHWDAIIQALNGANMQHSKSQDYYEPAIVTPTTPLPSISYNEWLPTNISSLEILLHHTKPVATETKSMEDFIKRQDSDYNTPNIHTWKAFPDGSHDGLLAPTFLNPLEVYLPDHVRYQSHHTNQPRENRHQKNIKASYEGSQFRRSQPSSTPNMRKPRYYIPWPNVDQVTTLNHTSHLKSLTLPQSQEPPISPNLYEMKSRREILLMNSGIFPLQGNQRKQRPNPSQKGKQSTKNSTETDQLGLNRPIPHTAPVNQQWPQTNKGNSQSQIQQSSNAVKSEFSEGSPLNPFLSNEFMEHLSQINNAHIGNSLKNTVPKFNLPIIVMRDSEMKQSPEVQQNKGSINQKELQYEQEAMNQKALLPREAMVPLPENQDFREKQESQVYIQPWLHAIVQNDLKNWGFPYDEKALQSLPPGYHHSSLPPSAKHHKDNNDFYTNLSVEVHNQKRNQTSLSPKVNAYHLAIVEAPHKPNNVPLPIRNVHVIAPTPNNIPPMPLFRPAEKTPIEFSPYVVNGALTRTQRQKNENPMLVIPHPAQELDPHERSSNLYPVMVPLKHASQRQDINPIQMIMQPIRDIFNLRNPSNNSRNKKPLPPQQIGQKQNFRPLTQLAPPPEYKKRNTSQSDFPIHIEFPGFGPPKGEDVVIMPDNSEHPRDEKDLSSQVSLEVLQEPITLDATQSPFLSQQLHDQNAQKESPSSGESQAQSIFSTVSQSQSFNHGKPKDHDTTAAATPHIPRDVFQQSLQDISTNFQPPRQIQQFRQENTKSSTDTIGHFHTVQLSNDEVLPPVVNTDTVKQPTSPPNPVFIPWPNIQNTKTAAPLTSHDTSSANVSLPQAQAPSQQSIPFFNRPSNIRPFRFPSLPSMDFLNPFNLFRSRENSQGKIGSPSLFSKADHEPSASMTITKFENPPSWPNAETQSNSASNFEPNNNSNISFLRDIMSSTNKNNGTFNFMPHLEPIFKDADKKLALENNPTSTAINSHLRTSYTSKPFIQPPSSIHSTDYNKPEAEHLADTQHPSTIYPINQNDPNIQSFFNQYPFSSSMDQTHHSQYTHLPSITTMPHYTLEKKPQYHFDRFQESKDKISPPENAKNSHLDNVYHKSRAFAHSSYSAAPRNQAAKVNPQVNPAYFPSSELELNKNRNLEPDLIKFTIDDVINVPDSDIHADPIPKITHTSDTRTKSQESTVDEDMDSSPSDEIIKVAEFVVKPQPSQPNIPMMRRITPNPSTTIISPLTKITKLPNVLQKTSTTISDLYTPSQMQSTNPSNIQLNISTFAPRHFLHKTHLSNSALNLPTTYKPSTNHTINTYRSSFFPKHWGITQSPDVQPNNTLVDKTENNRSSYLSSAASSRVTIIEATPMPKAGEIFPTLKHFRMFTSHLPPLTTVNPTTVATIIPSTTTPITPNAKRFGIDSVKQMQTTSPTPKIRTATRPLPPDSTKLRKRLEIMMPGRWNHRTISKPPQIESDSFTINTNKSNSKEHIITHNQFKVRYIAPPRKVHTNKPSPKPNLMTGNTPNISAVLPTTVSNETLPSSPIVFPSTAKINITEELPTTTSKTKSLKTQPVVLTRHSSAKTQSKIQENEKEENVGVEETLTTTPQYLETTTETTPEADRPFPSSNTARYNSIQRLRNFMANKRRNRTHTTPKATVLPTDSTLLMPVQIKMFKTNISAAAQPSKSPPTRLYFKTLGSFRTHRANRKTTPVTTKPTTAPITTTTTKSSLQVIKTTPQSTEESNLKGIDQEYSGSGSSLHEWHQPTQEVLQGHPEMFEFHKWESSRLDAAKNINNTHYPTDNQEYSHEDSEIVLHGVSKFPSMTVQPFRQATRVSSSFKSSHVEASTSSPVVLSPHYTSAAGSTVEKVQELSSSSHIVPDGKFGSRKESL